MTHNLENALHGLQEARTAIFVEMGNTDAKDELLEAIEIKIDEVEGMIKTYD